VKLTGRANRTVTRLEPGAAPSTEGNRPIDTPNGPTPRRRRVRLAALPHVDVTPEAPTRRESGAHRAGGGRGFPTSRDAWLVLAERVVGDWAATLRTALLLVLAVFAVLAMIGVAFGPEPAFAAAFLAFLVFLAGRDRGGLLRR
jgi:hypothetical protein